MSKFRTFDCRKRYKIERENVPKTQNKTIMSKIFSLLVIAIATVAAPSVYGVDPGVYYDLPVADRTTEVSVSYGAVPAMYHIKAMADHWDGLQDKWGTVSVTIDHKFADRLWAGLSYTFSTASAEHATAKRPGDLTWHALMLNGRYEWYKNGALTLYSHAAIGVLVIYCSPEVRESYNVEHMAFQASPICVQYDLGAHAAIFAEGGYGSEGVVNAGLRIGF